MVVIFEHLVEVRSYPLVISLFYVSSMLENGLGSSAILSVVFHPKLEEDFLHNSPVLYIFHSTMYLHTIKNKKHDTAVRKKLLMHRYAFIY